MMGGDDERRRACEEALDLLIFELGTDPEWRQRLFAAPQFAHVDVGTEYITRLDAQLGATVGSLGLRFFVFNDGYTEDGAVVFGFGAVEFPELTRYSTNWPHVL
jgi:hypothetical protein